MDDSSTTPAPSFEDALEQLEIIVTAMESGDTPLADLLTRFEEGNRLLKVCEARLQEAELKIEQLKQDHDGSLRLSPLDADSDEG